MSDQTPTLTLSLPRYRGGRRFNRDDRRTMNAIEQAKTAAWLASPEMVAHRSALMGDAALVASSLGRPTRAPVRQMMDAAMLDNVQFEDCALNGMSLKGASCEALRFEFTTARDLNVEDGRFHGVRQVRSDLSGWRMHMAYLKWFEDAEGVITAAALTENQKGAVRTLAVTGNREAAEKYLTELEAKSPT